MGLNETEVNDADESISEGNELVLYEIFFAGGQSAEEENGLVYKDIMREGEWAYRPGAGQKPTPIPLKVVPGYAESEEQIGMSDLVDAFNDRAIDHVTVPTSHEDRPHENTGYVKTLSVVKDDNGKAVLRAGLEFTEPEIKQKALRGSIANTSAGILFDYIKKDSGKKFRQALGHVALTNKPWLNGMKPFGVLASEDEEFEITPLILADVVWETTKSLQWLRDATNKEINKHRASDDMFYVSDITGNRALVTKFDNSGGTSDNYVVPFDVTDGEVQIPDEDKWIKASKEWVEASLSEEKAFNEFHKDFDNDSSLSEEAPNEKAAENDATNNTGGKIMASENKSEQEEVEGAPSNDSAQATDLSEEKIEQLRAEFSESLASSQSENETLRKRVHEMEVEKRVEELKSLGFSSQAGLLGTIRDLMLADNGKPALVLSEEGNDVSLSATDIIDRIVDAMPKTDKGSVDFGEQALQVDEGEQPPSTTDDTNLSEEDASQALAEGLGVPYKKKDGDE
jgi:hypothetical protein